MHFKGFSTKSNWDFFEKWTTLQIRAQFVFLLYSNLQVIVGIIFEFYWVLKLHSILNEFGCAMLTAALIVRFGHQGREAENGLHESSCFTELDSSPRWSTWSHWTCFAICWREMPLNVAVFSVWMLVISMLVWPSLTQIIKSPHLLGILFLCIGIVSEKIGSNGFEVEVKRTWPVLVVVRCCSVLLRKKTNMHLVAQDFQRLVRFFTLFLLSFSFLWSKNVIWCNAKW